MMICEDSSISDDSASKEEVAASKLECIKKLSFIDSNDNDIA